MPASNSVANTSPPSKSKNQGRVRILRTLDSVGAAHGIVAYKRDFDAYATTVLHQLADRAASHSPNGLVNSVTNQLESLFLSGGKRIRPYLLELAYRSVAGEVSPPVRKLAFALELFHLFCLVHDDIMDQADLRHGVPTVHALLAPKVGARCAHDQAILAGDLLFSWSMEVFHEALFEVADPRRARQASQSFSDTREQLVIGQMLDVDATVSPTLSQNNVYEKTRLKTSRYTFVGPVQMGFALAGYEDQTGFAESFGTSLGMAFQVQDDLLDIMSTPDTLQKPTFSDINQNQHTFLTQFLAHEAHPIIRQIWKEFRAGERSMSYCELRGLYECAGALEAGQQIVRDYCSQSRSELQSLIGQMAYLDEWFELVTLIENRVA